MKNIITLIIIVSCIQANAQISNVTEVSGKPINVRKYTDVEGSPYLGDGKWTTGTVITIFDQYVTDVKIRYNGYLDQLEFLKKGNVFFYENQNIRSFEYSDAGQSGNLERFYFKTGFEYKDELDLKNYVRVHYEGENVQVIEKMKIIKQKITPAAYGQSDYDKFLFKNTTYIVVGDKAYKTNLNKRGVTSTFPALKSEIKNYFKNNSSDLSSRANVTLLFDYIDSIYAE